MFNVTVTLSCGHSYEVTSQQPVPKCFLPTTQCGICKFSTVIYRVTGAGCAECDRGTPVPHSASRLCRSGGRNHCTCNACF